MDKVHPIAGDVSEPDLAIAEPDRRLLANTVQIVYHAAATIRFDESLKKAVLLNTRGTKLVLGLAREMKNLQVTTGAPLARVGRIRCQNVLYFIQRLPDRSYLFFYAAARKTKRTLGIFSTTYRWNSTTAFLNLSPSYHNNLRYYYAVSRTPDDSESYSEDYYNDIRREKNVYYKSFCLFVLAACERIFSAGTYRWTLLNIPVMVIWNIIYSTRIYNNNVCTPFEKERRTYLTGQNKSREIISPYDRSVNG